jgi:hypothetical protein
MKRNWIAGALLLALSTIAGLAQPAPQPKPQAQPTPEATAKPETAAPSAKPDVQKLGQQYTAWFYAGEADKIWALFSPEMQKAVGKVDNLRTLKSQVEAQAGAETSILEEKLETVGQPPVQVYVRRARFSKAPVPVVVQWAIFDDGKIGGFFIRPEQG